MRRLIVLTTAILLGGHLVSGYAAPPVPLRGDKLLLGVSPGHNEFRLETRGVDITNTNNTSADPVLHGATLRLFSSAGDHFDATYTMPSGANWEYRGAAGQNLGYIYKDANRVNGPISIIKIRAGRSTHIVGRDLVFTLHTNPEPVNAVFTIGDQGYCMSFGGTVKRFAPDHLYIALKAPAPALCPASPSGAFLDGR